MHFEQSHKTISLPNNEKLLNRKELAERWGIVTRSIDRLRMTGRLPWIDLSAGQGKRPCVRFSLTDILEYEQRFRMAATIEERKVNR